MGIKDVPETYDGFMHLLDDYERAHFDFDAGGRRVADSTLALMTTFYPRPLRKPVEVFSRALMDEPLLDAFGYAEPGPLARKVSRAAMKARARVLKHTPSHRKPVFTADLPRIKSLPRRLRPRRPRHPSGARRRRLPGAAPPGGRHRGGLSPRVGRFHLSHPSGEPCPPPHVPPPARASSAASRWTRSPRTTTPASSAPSACGG
ncbi:hypothetical protein [Nocardioides convexus]|uniref:hypothetical protein n=1 Tax=Nocardioides convexus TaxID=2712224 RepID=UPI0024187A98|nr:hypothetical protein [Nocardioides convexus]